MSGAQTVTAGDSHSCALDADAIVSCWGTNGFGQLGAGTALVRADAMPVALPAAAAEVRAGTSFTCARLVDGRVSCWGDDAYGQCGDGAIVPDRHAAPVAVAGLSDAEALSVGDRHACALRRGGEVRCWGSNLLRQLGVAGGDASGPVRSDAAPAARVVAAGGSHGCAGDAVGVRCWGNNMQGQLADGTTTTPPAGTSVVAMLDPPSAIALGHRHGCALRRGEVRCWGENRFGEVGDGSRTTRTRPAVVGGLAPTVAVAAGDAFGCALEAGGAIDCWGTNRYGQLGHGMAPWETTTVTTAPW